MASGSTSPLEGAIGEGACAVHAALASAAKESHLITARLDLVFHEELRGISTADGGRGPVAVLRAVAGRA